MKSNLWIEEKVGDFLGLRFKVEKTLFSGQSDFQAVDVVETKGHGRMLLNDGLIMVTERDEFVYHDMIAHPALFIHPSPKNVLIIGGGDGGTAREVLRHQHIERVVMVEIDKMVVDACKEFIPQTSAALSDPRLELIIGDGVEFMKNSKESFDIILIDSTDPIGPATPLFGTDFYRNVYKRLSEDGLVVSQGESPFYITENQLGLARVMSDIFDIFSLYNFSNLTYPGCLWSFCIGSKKYHPLNDFLPQNIEKSALEFEYYNEEIHRAAFSLPSFQKRALSGLLKT